jgi:hypothetical protein
VHSVLSAVSYATKSADELSWNSEAVLACCSKREEERIMRKAGYFRPGNAGSASIIYNFFKTVKSYECHTNGLRYQIH